MSPAHLSYDSPSTPFLTLGAPSGSSRGGYPGPSPYVFTEVYSLAHASPSASHWPLLPPPPLPPFLLSPCFTLSPHLSPIQPSSPIQPPSAALVDLVGPFCLPPPQLPRPAPQLGSKSSTSPSKRRSVFTVSTISSAPSSSRLKLSFTTLSTSSIPLCPRDQ